MRDDHENDDDAEDEGEDEDVYECELCGDDHETCDCGETLCGHCYESVENCNCEACDEIDAGEWIARGRPAARQTAD